MRDKVFISYSHRDTDWLERLRVHLKPLERQLPQLEIWDDARIKHGSKRLPAQECHLVRGRR